MRPGPARGGVRGRRQVCQAPAWSPEPGWAQTDPGRGFRAGAIAQRPAPVVARRIATGASGAVPPREVTHGQKSGHFSGGSVGHSEPGVALFLLSVHLPKPVQIRQCRSDKALRRQGALGRENQQSGWSKRGEAPGSAEAEFPLLRACLLESPVCPANEAKGTKTDETHQVQSAPVEEAGRTPTVLWIVLWTRRGPCPKEFPGVTTN